MKTIAMFSFGYYGWGNSTPRLVEAVDSIEASRGFQPPLFVDIRIRRSVRAVGFDGTTFEKLVGEARYRWMKDLGNCQIVTKTGPGIQIANPKAANDLLDLAMEAGEDNRRVIFFCSCPWPRVNGRVACHRTTVGTLLLAAARRRGVHIEIVEWPGGKPRRMRIAVAPQLFRSIVRGATGIPAGCEFPVGEVGGPPWGSIATVNSGGETIYRILGPTMWKKGEWCVQVLRWYSDPNVGLQQYREESVRTLKSYGLDARRSVE